MPSYFVIQPNGKYARFSTVVDDFTDYDMTTDEVKDCIREHLLSDLDWMHRTAIDNATRHSFQRCIDSISGVHGSEVARERLAQMSTAVASPVSEVVDTSEFEVPF